MALTVNEARHIGVSKLNISPDVFKKTLEIAKEMDVGGKDLAPMTLILAVMGVSQAHQAEELAQEMYDAAQLVAKAEKEWRLEVLVGRGNA